jgi:hypothetical protein
MRSQQVHVKPTQQRPPPVGSIRASLASPQIARGRSDNRMTKRDARTPIGSHVSTYPLREPQLLAVLPS